VQLRNTIYNAICALAVLAGGLPPELTAVIPANWRPWLLAVGAGCFWVKSHANLFVNPDGTPASVAYTKAPVSYTKGPDAQL